MTINNDIRQMAGASAIQHHMHRIDGFNSGVLHDMKKEDKECAITDTIADILHYAESVGIKSHSDICRVAQQHMMDELEQEGKE